MIIIPPTMKEINALAKPWTGMSFFAGCGGSSVGHKQSGIHMLASNEFVDIARETYELNHPGTLVLGQDIRRLDPLKILQYFDMVPGQLDFIDGSPPCKGYSTAGVVEKGWGKEVQYSDNKVQQVDDLFDQYCRMLETMQPKTFVAENVSGLIKGQSKGYFIEVMRQFKRLGYKVRAPMLNSAWLGVPQSRERIIFMGVREDLDFDVPDVKPLSSMAILSEHPKLGHIVGYKHLRRGLIQYLPACNSPMPTITAADNIAYETARFSTAGFIEDDSGARRKLTIEELISISGMPSDYKLLGKFEQQWERLGRICVPAVAHAASSALVRNVLIPYYKSKKKKPGSRIL